MVGGLTGGLLVFDVGGGATLSFVVEATLAVALGVALGTLGGAALALSVGVVEGIVVGAPADVVGAVSSAPPVEAGAVFGCAVLCRKRQWKGEGKDENHMFHAPKMGGVGRGSSSVRSSVTGK